MPSLSYSRVISLSHPIYPQIPHWPGDPLTKFSVIATWERDGYFLRKVEIGEHSATHLNAPRSFDPKGQGVAEISPEQLILQAVCLDVRDRCQGNPDYEISVADLKNWERNHQKIPPGCLVIANTGWHQKWSDPVEFLGNSEDENQLHFPGFGEDTTKFLMGERQVAGVVIDTHGVDPGISETFGVNRRVLTENGVVLECLTNLESLPPVGFTVMIGALPLVGGSGSPVQVLALLP